MTTEEKAKAYDHALEVIEKYKGANIMFTQDLKEEMFPELAENEDEKIRKELLSFIKSVQHSYLCATDKRKKWVAYLEKQKEQKPAEWSEEDEDMRYKATAILNRLCASKEEFVWQPKTLIKIFNWLKSLPERFNLQPKQEWSEEDEVILRDIKFNFEYNKENMTAALQEEYDKFFAKIKSLRPQPHWKPTEEQMKALDMGIRQVWTKQGSDRLMSLYKDLKKL